MSAEVAGQAEGVTLLEAIEGGDVPYPERMSYVAWLKWRRETGSRPLSKRDGISTTPEQEAALWRKVMKFLHDAEDEDEDEEEEEEDSELVPEASGAGGDSPPRVDVSAAARELAMVPIPVLPMSLLRHQGPARRDRPVRRRQQVQCQAPQRACRRSCARFSVQTKNRSRTT